MARIKRMRMTTSNASYLSQQEISTVQSDLHSQANASDVMQSEESSEEGVEMVIQDEQGHTAKTRGKTLLRDLYKLHQSGLRVVVRANDLGQPIGPEAGLLGQFLGTVARNPTICSLTHKTWLVLKEVAEYNILSAVKARFVYSKSSEKWILKSVNNKWSQYKSNLKSMYFKENVPSSELCKNVPEGIIPDQWCSLVYHWKSTEAQVCHSKLLAIYIFIFWTISKTLYVVQASSERNRRARAMRKTTHTAGTKSFARHAHEMKMNLKDETHRAKFYLATHKLDEEISVAIEKHVQEQVDSGNNLGGTVSWEGNALSQVLGKDPNGRVRGVGLLPTPKNVIGTSGKFRGLETTTMDEKMLIDLVHQLRVEINNLRDEIDHLKTVASVDKGNTNPSDAAIAEKFGFLDLLSARGEGCELSDYQMI
ncbi:Plant transposase (Ptta/En/Spm family) [Rhynchospora pubera]|uniref:Plant transposase (Ptta/En/Spm family) n=1 Tax=Rhynchospora pubera TaxID=906938 RepID=A0AAV8C0K8_9POAL|nr:Plant transposase (Ptta/En/Spm family) [Rhynchospora pubera]